MHQVVKTDFWSGAILETSLSRVRSSSVMSTDPRSRAPAGPYAHEVIPCPARKHQIHNDLPAMDTSRAGKLRHQAYFPAQLQRPSHLGIAGSEFAWMSSRKRSSVA